MKFILSNSISSLCRKKLAVLQSSTVIWKNNWFDILPKYNLLNGNMYESFSYAARRLYYSSKLFLNWAVRKYIIVHAALFWKMGQICFISNKIGEI